MVRKSLDIKLLRDFTSLRTQTITVSLLIVCGVSLLVSSWSAYTSLQSAKDVFYETYHFADIFSEFKVAPKSLQEKLSHISGIEFVETRILMDGLVFVRNQEVPAQGIFLNVPSDTEYLNKLYIRNGKLPEEGEKVEVAVHEAFASAHQLSIGDDLNIIIRGQNQRLTVVGIVTSPEFVYALNPNLPLPDNLHFGVFWLTRKSLEYLSKMNDEANSILVKLNKKANPKKIIKKIDDLLKLYGNKGAYERNRQISNMFVEDEIRQQRVSSFFLPFVFLGVASFLINIIISRLISLQRLQIATFKAIGYSNDEVTKHYLKLILLMLLVGTLPGLALGAYLGKLLTKSYKNFFHFPALDFFLNPDSALIGVLAGLVPGLVGGFFTLRAIYNLMPAEAMRPPAPQIFLPNFFEKWKLHRYFEIRSRMILRNLLQKRLRLFFMILGLSASLAVIITAGSWVDMIDFLITTQFQRQQREDLSIGLYRPAKKDFLRELNRIDGIMASEPYRFVPIRIKYKNYKKEIGLFGRTNKDQMFKILDKDLNSIKIPDEGLLLSRYFQLQWDMKVGDKVEVEILEGELRTIHIKISGFVDDLIGTGAYIHTNQLSQVLKENKVYTHASLKVDPYKSTHAFINLKKIPLISSVIIKGELLKGFKQSMGGLIRIFTGILTAFSLMITLGIIYNSIRLTFSERSWEMSSLMVLGFGRESVFRMLSMEVIIQVLLAIIPGCFAGWGLVSLSMKMIHAETFSFPVIIDRSTYAMAILFVFIVLLGSFLKTYQLISRLSLSEALKTRE